MEPEVIEPTHAVILLTYAAVGLVVVVGIIAFNVPKALVPPARRAEEGLYFRGLQRRLRRRR